MASDQALILTLPNELLQLIIDYLQPDDLVNFCLTNSHIQAVAAKHLTEHRRRLERYSSILIQSPDLECTHPPKRTLFSHPLFLLHELYQDPAAAYYIRIMIYNVRNYYTARPPIQWPVWPNFITDEGVEIALQTSDSFNSMLQHYDEFDGPFGIEQFSDAFRRGDVTFAMHSILRSTRNLTFLKPVECLATSWFEGFFEKDGSPNRQLLPSLHTVDMGAAQDAFQHTDLIDIRHWMSVPSVRSLRARDVVEESMDEDFFMATYYPCAPVILTTLILVDCNISGSTVALLLSNLTGLRRFGMGCRSEHTTTWSWRTLSFLNALERSAASTLETLVLWFPAIACKDRIPSLAPFSKLHTFRGALAMLPYTMNKVSNHDDDIPALDIKICFNASLRHLTLLTVETFDNTKYRLGDAISLENLSACPDLTTIELTSGDLTAESIQDLRAQNGIFRCVRSSEIPELQEDYQFDA